MYDSYKVRFRRVEPFRLVIDAFQHGSSVGPIINSLNCHVEFLSHNLSQFYTQMTAAVISNLVMEISRRRANRHYECTMDSTVDVYQTKVRYRGISLT